MIMPKRALLSVTDKTGVVDLAKELVSMGVELLSTGGTRKVIADAGIEVKEVSEETGFPEIMGGRVKTLHPKIAGGILYRRGLDEDEKAIIEHGINPIDIVVVNLYDFASYAENPESTDSEIIEHIDIGGPSLIRAAAKNWEHVAVLTTPEQYPTVIDALKSEGGISREIRWALASDAFMATAGYDRKIANWFDMSMVDQDRDPIFPSAIHFCMRRKQIMRYGENPHQNAAFYILEGEENNGVASGRQLHGKEISFNNLIDADIAMALPFEFEEPCVAILKHTTPSGVGIGETIAEAEARARACDPVSAYGGIVGMNRVCDKKTALQINKAFTEVIVAPGFDEDALEILKKKKNLRLVEIDPGAARPMGWDIRRVAGGMLLQDRDYGFPELEKLEIVTKRQPTAEEMKALLFSWKVCKYVKSNAVLFARDGQTLGLGAGQMSRVDAVRLAGLKAQDSELDLTGSVLASDAYFPFADGLLEAVKRGATAIIQPGGSIRDEEVIAAADENNIAMVMTGRRHFRHA